MFPSLHMLLKGNICSVRENVCHDFRIFAVFVFIFVYFCKQFLRNAKTKCFCIKPAYESLVDMMVRKRSIFLESILELAPCSLAR